MPPPQKKAPSCTLPMSTLKALVWGLTFQGLFTFCNVPRDSSQEHFAGVDRVLVVSGRQLPAPGASCFIHSLEKTPVILSTGSFPSPSPTGLPIFPNYRLSRATQTHLSSQHVEAESGPGLEQAPCSASVCTEATCPPPPSVGPSPGPPFPTHLLPADEAGLLFQY